MTTRRKRRERPRAREFPAEGRPHQYTYEGMIGLLGDFAAGANRARGWKRFVAKALVLSMLLPVLWSVAKFLTPLVN